MYTYTHKHTRVIYNQEVSLKSGRVIGGRGCHFFIALEVIPGNPIAFALVVFCFNFRATSTPNMNAESQPAQQARRKVSVDI